jgi:hypothetical protein
VGVRTSDDIIGGVRCRVKCGRVRRCGTGGAAAREAAMMMAVMAVMATTMTTKV